MCIYIDMLHTHIYNLNLGSSHPLSRLTNSPPLCSRSQGPIQSTRALSPSLSSTFFFSSTSLFRTRSPLILLLLPHIWLLAAAARHGTWMELAPKRRLLSWMKALSQKKEKIFVGGGEGGFWYRPHDNVCIHSPLAVNNAHAVCSNSLTGREPNFHSW